MSRVAIVTDSTANLTPELYRKHGITVVPLNVHFGDQVYRDQIDMDTAAFMSRLTSSNVTPTTSQPSPGLFAETFERLAADHDEVLAVLLSSKLSGTVSSAGLAASQVRDKIKVEIVDSLNGSLGLGLQVLRAVDLTSGGMTAAEAATRMRGEVAAYHMVFFVDTLEFLQRGGRIGRAASLVGTLLKLKPVLRVDEGQVVPFERTRTRSKAIDALKEFVSGFPSVSRLGVLYSSERADAEKLATEFSAVVPADRLVIAQFSPVIGAHVGPGAMGVCVAEAGAP